MDKTNSNARQNIRVFVRVRPTLPLEGSSRSVLDCSSNTEITLKDNVKGKISDRVTKTFRFDQVFSPQSSQVEVYRHVVEPLLEEVLQGYSCTVFAYGQTGTGKTFTMEGERTSDSNNAWGNDPNAGIIPRTLSELFDRLRLGNGNYAVRISFLELYNEELIDLLSPPEDTTKLRLFEDSTKKGAVIISGLEEVEVCSKADVYKILERGSLKRRTASTLMNARSSRSHTVFTATVYIRGENVGDQQVLCTGKINLVDLAGSENIGRSGAIDKRAREAGNINQSLLTLGRVITALVDQSPHVPYRESKLTRLLQESLGGRTKTSIIATVSPAICNYEETLSTLEYAHRAKNIQNKPEVNQKLSKKLHLNEYTEEIERLQRDLEAQRQRSGVFLDRSEYEEMLSRLNALAAESNEKVEHIKALQEEKLKQEALCNEVCDKLEAVSAVLEENEAALEAEKCTLFDLQSDVEKTLREEREQTHLLARHWDTAQKLKIQATELKYAAEVSSTKTTLLHGKLERVRSVAKTNENLGVEMQTEVTRNIESGLNVMKNGIQDNINEILALKTHLKAGVESVEACLLGHEDSISRLIETETQTIDRSHKILSDCSESDALWALEYRDIVRKGKDTFAVDQLMDTSARAFKIIRDQAANLETGVGDLHSRSADVDTWRESFRAENVDIINRYSAALLQEKLPTLTSNLSNFESVKSVTLDLKKKHQIYIEKMRQQLLNAEKALETTESLSEEWRNTTAAWQAKITEFAAKFSEEATNLRNSFDEFLTQGNEDLSQTKEKHAQRASEMCTGICNSINEWDTADNLGDLPSSIFAMTGLARSAWNAQLDATSRHIEKETASTKEATQLLNACLEEIKVTMEEGANKNSGDLDETASKLSSLTTDMESLSSKYGDSVKKWTSSLEDIVSDCYKRVECYVNKDFREDVPTGATPQRGCISYPRDLAVTSPHERILGRFRERLLEARLSSEEDGATSSDSSSPSLEPIPAAIDESVKNKENSDTIRESPLKKPEKKQKRRKPLVSQNCIRQ